MNRAPQQSAKFSDRRAAPILAALPSVLTDLVGEKIVLMFANIPFCPTHAQRRRGRQRGLTSAYRSAPCLIPRPLPKQDWYARLKVTEVALTTKQPPLNDIGRPLRKSELKRD